MEAKPLVLTVKQKKFFEALKIYMVKHGKSPTVSELVRLMRFSSPRAVTQHLASLERKGLIRRERYKERGIELANNAVILRPVSTDPHYKPIIMHRNCNIFGKVLDIIRVPQKGDLEIVPIYPSR